MNVVARAQDQLAGHRLRLALPEAADPRISAAAARLTREHGVRCVLIGPAEALHKAIAREGLSIDAVDIIDPDTQPPDLTLINACLSIRPDMRPSIAERLTRKPLMRAGLLVATGHADAMLAGATCPTARVIEVAMMTIGLAEGVQTPSSCFLIRTDDRSERTPRTLLFADCAVNADPTPSELADIALASAQTLRQLTNEQPRIAFLSFSTHGSAKHPHVDRVRTAVELARARAPQLAIDGELQADAAISPRVAKTKLTTVGDVAGRANILVFPDLDAANIAYKLVQHLGGAEALGPFLQGFAKPVSDLSRGATVDDVVRTALVTLLRALPR
ncbi:MAG: phosphate acetyltransferase [Betaproteobacteria bacterium]|nr:phosphate acetyltransferase [Betaproteobacteria bacterium]